MKNTIPYIVCIFTILFSTNALADVAIAITNHNSDRFEVKKNGQVITDWAFAPITIVKKAYRDPKYTIVVTPEKSCFKKLGNIF